VFVLILSGGTMKFLFSILLACSLLACNNNPPTTNRAPIAQFGVSNSVADVGTELTFNANTSSDPDSDALTYAWDFNDGSTGLGLSVKHAFASIGVYNVKLTVNDGKLENSITSKITISPPVVISNAWQTVNTGDVSRTLQKLRVSANARGDAAAIWEDYPDKLRASIYSADKDAWSPATIFETTAQLLAQPTVKMFGNGTARAVWLEIPVAGGSLKWRTSTSFGELWNAPSDVLTFGADSEGVTDPELVVNNFGNAAFTWLESRATAPAYSKTFVASFKGNTWTSQQLGDNNAGPAKIALDNAGNLSAIYGSKSSSGNSNSVFVRRYDFTTQTWEQPVSILESNSRYSCQSEKPCYAISSSANGKAMALLWDAAGSIGTLGTISSRVYDLVSKSWQNFLDSTVATEAGFPFLASQGDGSAMAVYNKLGKLESRRFNASTNTWKTAKVLDGYFTKELQLNFNGEAMVNGITNTVGELTSANLGFDWQPVTKFDDFTVCRPPETTISLDDNGIAMLAQVCRPGGQDSPMFIRAKRFSIR
jgi:PKD repeat protein